MIIEVGGKYIDRRGKVIGPLVACDIGQYKLSYQGWGYLSNGRIYKRGDHVMDLISPLVAEPDPYWLDEWEDADA